MEDTSETRKVSILLGLGIFLMPFIFAWFTLRKGYSRGARFLSFSWLFFFVVWALISGPEPEEMRATREAKEQEEREQEEAEKLREQESGLHCLSSWDGSSRPFKQAIVSALRDPDSFEHIETRITKRNPDGEHGVVMKYRARNGFGGMNVSTAIGAVDSQTCEVTRINDPGG